MRLIRFFTKEGGRVLDPFLGVGSTLKACALSGRWGVGVELIERWVSLSRRRLSEEVGPHALASQEVIRGDSRIVLQDSGRFPDASMDFVVCSPPYWKILTKKADHKVKSERLKHGLATQYSEEPADLGNMPDYLAFLDGVCDVFDQCWRILKPGKYAAIVVGDFRHHNRFIAYHADLFERLTNPAVGGRYEPQGIIIWAQNHKRLYPYGYPFAFVPNLHHQYVLIVRKPKEKADRAQPKKPGRQAPRIKAKD
jgi:DNA modification methylase